MGGLINELLIAAHGVWRRRWLALAIAWGVALLGWLVVALIPNSYESRARVFVQMQTLLPGKIGITTGEQQRTIDQVRQTLTSGVNLQKVIRGTDLSQEVHSDADLAAAVEKLSRAITIKAQQDNLFEITARASAGGLSDAQNAKLARAIVQKLIDIFVEENLAGDRDETEQTIRFLDGELARRQAGLDAADRKRAEFESKFMGMLPGSGSLQQRLEQARTEMSSVDMQLIAAQSAASAMSGQLGSTPATIPVPGATTGGGRVAALQGQLADATAKGWTDAHPDVIAIKGQIARLRAAGGDGASGAGSMANPMYASVRAMLAEKQGTVAALQARKAQLAGDMAAFAAKQVEEPEMAAQQAQLNRDYEVLKAQYDKLLQDREDVRLRSEVASKTDAVQFRVIDPPSSPRLPVAPPRPLLLFGVLIVALGAGVAGAFALGQLKTTYTTPEKLAQASGLPVLGAIGEVVTPGRAAAARQRLVWFAGGSGALAACCALLLVVEFVRRGLVA
ncbi:XrtA system polysaccharide chain length determinant [Sphingomonas jatrophae]|uniref:Polysaccharide chain length determinant protein, PEP-CTERM locus subfamily n=1 Tax=Sphingomonas jatrophae TaxID=1166337 RepID=A0A1I6JWT1_9SPHN|nr:XrtA system polysaccharide chain length determinant [Sphingomonas jatrophae]SFR83432.1 polysaccharide chain length determinant protein, PEP-CTERM locus subfamily [Sphingomonas jatrophae]